MVKATPCPARSDRRKIRLNLSMPLRNPSNTPISPVPDFAIHCGSSVLTIKRSLIALYNDVYDEHLFVFAAGLSYYFVLSLFPLLVSMASLLGYVPIPHLFEGLLSLMAKLVPGDGMSLVRNIVSDVVNHEHLHFFTLGLIFTIWTVS